MFGASSGGVVNAYPLFEFDRVANSLGCALTRSVGLRRSTPDDENFADHRRRIEPPECGAPEGTCGTRRASRSSKQILRRFAPQDDNYPFTLYPQSPAKTSVSEISISNASVGTRQCSMSRTISPGPRARDTSTTLLQRSTSHTSSTPSAM